MKPILYIIAGPMFVVSFGLYLYLSRKLKKQYDPALAKYNKWTKITFAIAVFSALLLFIAAII